MIEVAVILVSDGYASVANLTCDVFRSVGVVWNACLGEPLQPQFRVRTASIDGRPASAWGEVVQTPEAALEGLERPDLIFVPDAGLDPDVIIEKHRALIPWLQREYARGARIASACSGVALLAEAGLLDGRQATTHWAMVQAFEARWPAVKWRTEAVVTEDQGVFCGGGVFACIDLSLYLVEKYCGRELALQTARAMLLDMPRVNQASFAVLPISTPHSDVGVRRVEEILQARYRDDVRVEQIAEQVGMSSRTLERRFQAATGALPRTYIQKLRIADARQQLENGSDAIQTVASTVGYDDLQFFRKVFKRHTGLSPGAYRRQFGAPPASVLTQRG